MHATSLHKAHQQPRITTTGHGIYLTGLISLTNPRRGAAMMHQCMADERLAHTIQARVLKAICKPSSAKLSKQKMHLAGPIVLHKALPLGALVRVGVGARCCEAEATAAGVEGEGERACLCDGRQVVLLDVLLEVGHRPGARAPCTHLHT